MHPCLRKLKLGDTIICDKAIIYYFTRFTGKDNRFIVVRPKKEDDEYETILHPSHYFDIKIFKAPSNESLAKKEAASTAD